MKAIIYMSGFSENDNFYSRLLQGRENSPDKQEYYGITPPRQ